MLTTSEILNRYPCDRKYLLSVLHDLMDAAPRHYLSVQVLTQVASHFEMNKGVVFGLAGYYTMLSLEPEQPATISVCCSPVCAHAGAGELLDMLSGDKKLQDEFQLNVTRCECLGLCAEAPAAALGNEFITKLDTGNIIGKIQKGLKKTRS